MDAMTKYRTDMKRYIKVGLLLTLITGLLWLLDARMRLGTESPEEREQRVEKQIERRDRVAVLHYQVSALRDAVTAAPASVERNELIERIDLFGRRANEVWGLEESEERFEQLVYEARAVLEQEVE